MKKSLLSVICCCIFIAAVCVPAFSVDSYEEVEGRGVLIDSDPSGAKVYVDGVERGLTPLYLESLPSGGYSIRVTKDGYEDRRFRLTARRGSRVEVSVDLEEANGRIILEIRRDPAAPPEELLPLDPFVYVDGVRIYERSLSLPIGLRVISAEAFGWEKKSETVYIGEDSVQRLELVMKSAAFALSNTGIKRKRFNPQNSGALGSTEAVFSVSAPGNGMFEIFSREGKKVYEGGLGPFKSWSQQLRWNGRDGEGRGLPDGQYTIRISAWAVLAGSEEAAVKSAELSVELDSSLEIRPLSIASAQGGLLFAPSPESLPRGSYQISALLEAGKPPGEAVSFASLPLALALRFAPVERLEISAALNVTPRFFQASGVVLWGGGASVKWTIAAPGKGPAGLGAALSLAYGWAGGGPYTSFGLGTGLNLSFPVSMRFTPADVTVDLILSPFLLWAGSSGHPDSAAPRPGAGAGLLLRYGAFGGGLSLRWDFDPKELKSGPLVSALEFSYLLPANVILSASGGVWLDQSGVWGGAFFGLGLGFMY
jgi:hypothetical protein